MYIWWAARIHKGEELINFGAGDLLIPDLVVCTEQLKKLMMTRRGANRPPRQRRSFLLNSE